MSSRLANTLMILSAALLAAALGLVASVAINGPGALVNSPLGRQLVALWPAQVDPPGLYIADLGEAAPAFTLVRLDTGAPHTVRPAGRPLLINYWASWCGPCRQEMPLLATLSMDQRPGAIEVVAIALDTAYDAGAYLEANPLPFAVMLETPSESDSSVRLGNRRGVLPYSVLIGADGRVVSRRFGAFSDQQDLQDWAASAPPKPL